MIPWQLTEATWWRVKHTECRSCYLQISAITPLQIDPWCSTESSVTAPGDVPHRNEFDKLQLRQIGCLKFRKLPVRHPICRTSWRY